MLSLPSQKALINVNPQLRPQFSTFSKRFEVEL